MKSLLIVCFLSIFVFLIGANNLFIVEVRDGATGPTNLGQGSDPGMIAGGGAETEQEEGDPAGYREEETYPKDPKKAMKNGDYADIFYDTN